MHSAGLSAGPFLVPTRVSPCVTSAPTIIGVQPPPGTRPKADPAQPRGACEPGTGARCARPSHRVPCVETRQSASWEDQRAHSNRKLRFQGFCRSIRLIERVFWSFYSTVRSDMQYWLAFSWPYNLLSDKVLRITVYSCANAPAGPSCAWDSGDRRRRAGLYFNQVTPQSLLRGYLVKERASLNL